MKTQEIFFPNLQIAVLFYIGENAQDNFDIIDMGKETDFWFHAKNVSSCHVVAILPDEHQINKIKKQKMHTIIHQGGLLCKQHTSKIRNQSKVELIYTKLKNVVKTDTIGQVMTTNTKEIII